MTPCRENIGETLGRGSTSPAWYFLPLLMALGLTACGFHLRQPVEIPPGYNPMFIEGGNLVRHALIDQLSGSTVQLTANQEAAGLVVHITKELRSSRVLAVDQNGKALAYELHYLVSFDATAKDGAAQVPEQTMDLVRNFDNPDVEVLGKQLESELIYEDMALDAAQLILLRLRAALL